MVEDLFRRRIVGWSMAATMESRLVVDAPEMGLARRLKGPSSSGSKLVAHSDRGSRYASEHYRRRLREERIEWGTSGVGQCWDNAAMASFFASLKKELVHDEDYATRDEARASICEYIEAFYNPARRHSSLGYVAPDEYERTYNQTHRETLPTFRGELQSHQTPSHESSPLMVRNRWYLVSDRPAGPSTGIQTKCLVPHSEAQ